MPINDVSTFAAIDLGSNSFHLLLARQVDGRLEVLHKEKQRVYLASGLDERFYLDDDAIDRAVAVLKQFALTVENFSAANIKVVATYTLRKARNLKRFMQRARAVFPFHIDVISGQEEARLIYQGVAHNLHHDYNRLVFDIGGGSTELVVGKHDKHLSLSSRNMGCVSYAKEFFKEGKITPKRFKRAIIRAEQELESIAPSFNSIGWAHTIATSGTAKSLTLVCNLGNLNEPLTLTDLQLLMEQAIAAGNADNLDFEHLSPERHPTFAAGLAITIAIMRYFSIAELEYCDYALREGLMYELLDKHAQKDIRQATIENLSHRYVVDKGHAQRVCDTLNWLFPQVANAWQLSDKEDLPSLLWAARLHEVGLSINSSGLHKHSAYIIANTQLPGFTQEQQLLLSCLMRFYRKKVKLREMPEFISVPQTILYRLIALLRLAVLLNQKRQADHKPNIDVTCDSHSLTLRFPKKWLDINSLLLADLHFEQQQWKKLGLHLEVH